MVRMRHVRLSAGDSRVDRRFEFVEVLEREGDLQAAQEVLCAAVDAWQQALRLDPDDTLGAGIILEVAGARAMQAQMPAAFVEALFDQYAERFDRSLVEPLGYRVPQRLGALVSEVSQARFAQALDLGCGTGLSGAAFRPICDHLSGVDLSSAMLRKAQKRSVYDVLTKGDIGKLPPLDAPVYDLVLAADVLIYLGDLTVISHWVAQALHGGGMFAFSVEAATENTSYVIQPSRRYAHARCYIEQIFGATGWSILTLSHEVLRQDRGRYVWGYLCVVHRDREAAHRPAMAIDVRPRVIEGDGADPIAH
jgi:predicted TPR repeat methyltransferase